MVFRSTNPARVTGLPTVLGSARAPDGLYDDLHRRIDEGLVDAPRRRAPLRLVLGLGGGLCAALAAAAILLVVIGPWRDSSGGMELRGDHGGGRSVTAPWPKVWMALVAGLTVMGACRSARAAPRPLPPAVKETLEQQTTASRHAADGAGGHPGWAAGRPRRIPGPAGTG